jgi:hypothetical protein
LAGVSASCSDLSLAGAAGQLIGIRRELTPCASQHVDEGRCSDPDTGPLRHFGIGRNQIHIGRASALKLGVVRLQV